MGGGGNYWAFVGAGLKAAGDRMGGWGPKPDEFIGRRAQRTSKWPYKDLKALREGGIDDPRLNYLGATDATKTRLREDTEGTATAGEQSIRMAGATYGGISPSSGVVMENLSRLRAGRTLAMNAAIRDLDLEKWNNFGQMQGMYGRAHTQFQNDDEVAYQRAMKYWQTKKDHYKMAGEALGDAATQYGASGGAGMGGGGMGG